MGIMKFPPVAASWSEEIAVGADIFDFYDSLGDVTIDTPTTIQTEEDGPIKVVRYGALNVNNLITVDKRCRGLLILCDSFTGGATGGISMTKRGAAGQPWWPWYDLTIPNAISLASQYMPKRAILDYIREHGIFIGDPVFWARPPVEIGQVVATLTDGVAILEAAGCGAKTVDKLVSGTQYTRVDGIAGNAGVKGTGGGGRGGGNNQGSYAWVYGGGRGLPWGGGPGSSGGGGINGETAVTWPPDEYGGVGGRILPLQTILDGGGAGNLGGKVGVETYAKSGEDGTGGPFLVLSKTDITVASGFLAQSDGAKGGDGVNYGRGGGGSGAGFQAWIRGGTETFSGTRRCNGGLGGVLAPLNPAQSAAGGPGGAGAIRSMTFTELGWS